MSLQQRLRELPPELRTAGIAAAALAFSLVFPWYQKSVIPPGGRELVQTNLSALGVFSFVEAAVLLVAGGVLYLIWARAQGKAFHLPGGDGFVISLAGGWATALLVWRLFDKPNVGGQGATVGIQWGIFVAMVAAGGLIAAGARVRAAGRPEPPNPAEEEGWEEPAPRPRRTADREPRAATAVTDVLRDRPAWSGEPPEAPRGGRGGRAQEPPEAPEPPRGRTPEPPPDRAPDSPPAPDRLF